MYINSDFTDYYDFCTGFGQDPKIVYNRKTESISPKAKSGLINARLDPSDPADFFRMLADLVGNLNPSVSVRAGGVWKVDYPISFYSIGGHPHFWISETNQIVAYPEAREYRASKQDKKKSFIFYRPRDYTKDLTTENLTALHRYLETPVFGVDMSTAGMRTTWIKNPNLKNLKFPVDPFDVYAKIFTYFQAPEPTMVQVEDKYKALAHGMDNMSFKREPGGPTRKRKKL